MIIKNNITDRGIDIYDRYKWIGRTGLDLKVSPPRPPCGANKYMKYEQNLNC